MCSRTHYKVLFSLKVQSIEYCVCENVRVLQPAVKSRQHLLRMARQCSCRNDNVSLLCSQWLRNSWIRNGEVFLTIHSDTMTCVE